jgi:hypothetical protein
MNMFVCGMKLWKKSTNSIHVVGIEDSYRRCVESISFTPLSMETWE